MKICLCHPFSDKDAKAYLCSRGKDCCQVSEVYKACSGGNNPNCCRCLETLKDLVRSHNVSKDAIETVS